MWLIAVAKHLIYLTKQGINWVNHQKLSFPDTSTVGAEARTQNQHFVFGKKFQTYNCKTYCQKAVWIKYNEITVH